MRALVKRFAVPSALVLLTTFGAGLPADAGSGHPDNGIAVAVTDQASHRILVLDPAQTDWSAGNAAALKWSWQPTAAEGFADPTQGWGLPDGVRLRHGLRGGYVMTVTDSYGLVALVSYPSGRRIWSTQVGTTANPHDAEVLPNGDIAVAASTPGWVRVYAAAERGTVSQHYVEYDMPGAHSVLWDPGMHLLWALDDTYISAFRLAGTAAEPRLDLVRKTLLPEGSGHFLQPVYGDTNRLWVAVGSYVYQYLKHEDLWSTSYRGAAHIDRYAVKSVGSNPLTGQVLETVPSDVAHPGSCADDWCTQTVDFFLPNAERTRPGAQFYKAIWWWPDYQ